MPFSCPYCAHKPFDTRRALSQHQQRKQSCMASIKASFGADKGYMTAHEFLVCVASDAFQKKQASALFAYGNGQKTVRLTPKSSNDAQQLEGYSTAVEYNSDNELPDFDADDEEEYAHNEGEDADNEEEDASNEEEESHNDEEMEPEIDRSMLDNFREYSTMANGFAQFPVPKLNAIKLMATLRKTNASLKTYETVMEWHLKANGQMHLHESVGCSKYFYSRKSIFQDLKKRYNMHNNWNITTQLLLPSSKANVNIVWTEAKMALQSLLTDPRIKAKDYLFFDEDPFKPPTNLNYIADLNTGKAYMETYKKLITDPEKQILLPTPLYIDGAATGQFANLPITAVKISLGILSRVARDQPHMWRTLGYIPPNSKDKSRGRRLFIESGHLDATRAIHESRKNEGQLTGNEAHHAQDFHAILDMILASYVKIQETGFVWDLFYNGHLYKDVEFIPFVPFIKCDTDEADVLTGSYKSRGRHVAQLCRYCECPTMECDDPLANYPLKRQNKIQRLVDLLAVDELKALSQQCIQNATYKLRFGLHNKCGVHGATPLEMLHALLLGIFKYMRDTFFLQTGKTSQTSSEINALAKEFGHLLSRQSDRDMPKTKFSNGIREGKLMAKEYTGILLCLLIVLRSKKGKSLVRQMKKFFGEDRLDNWILLIETLLEWEEWMKSPKLMKKHVRAARQKHRYVMYLIKKVANRTIGMGLKITKFHAIVHIADDILNFGVPMEVDTGSNESGHKPTKRAAKLTQKNKATFEIQTATRLEEMHLLDLALEEIEGRPLWDYFNGFENYGQLETELKANAHIGGTKFRCYTDNEGINQCAAVRKIKGKLPHFMLEATFIDFVVGLQDAVNMHIPKLIVHGKYTRNGQIFHANVAFQGSVWRDWVWVDWGPGYGTLPNKLWGFVDFTALPPNSKVNYGGINSIAPGIYAIVESATMIEDEHSELVLTIETEVVHNAQGEVHNLQFFLADVEAFVEPATVVPDIGGNKNRYLLVINQLHWKSKFERWLDDPHEWDEMDPVVLENNGEEDDYSGEEDNNCADSVEENAEGDEEEYGEEGEFEAESDKEGSDEGSVSS